MIRYCCILKNVIALIAFFQYCSILKTLISNNTETTAGQVNNIEYLVTMAIVKEWDRLGSK